jgi:hypothetical protein
MSDERVRLEVVEERRRIEPLALGVLFLVARLGGG